MTRALSDTAQIDFDAQVKAAYMTSAQLNGTYRQQAGVIGTQYNFRRFGNGVARQHQPSQRAQAMGLGGANVPCTLLTWRASEFTDKAQQTDVNFDELPFVAQVLGAACARRKDQAVIDAMVASAATAIPHGSTGLTYDKATLIRRYFVRNAVPIENITIAIGADQERNILSENRLTSRDWVGSVVVENGRITRILGMTARVLDDRPEGGLPLATNIRTCFAYDRNAVGVAMALEERATVTWDADRYSWMTDQVLKLGAVTIDPVGALPVLCQET